MSNRREQGRRIKFISSRCGSIGGWFGIAHQFCAMPLALPYLTPSLTFLEHHINTLPSLTQMWRNPTGQPQQRYSERAPELRWVVATKESRPRPLSSAFSRFASTTPPMIRSGTSRIWGLLQHGDLIAYQMLEASC